ncbi:hypothetical protein ASD00_18440 [Ensifer sp. Root31]|uniref:hypothetical protein n=1 Tax=Ensifer sp. Root31 TaxID=1736512 RepID=UPI00070CEF84|nr:hypothetical protein [Ensifer sp. Root31]KQU96825.1 hypothetical protein ASD00_18440 [Ensifer sp. Root31]
MTETSNNAISRELLGKIVDEVFDGAIEDAGVIEEIYAVIARDMNDRAALSFRSAEAGKPVASTHEERIALATALTWDINIITPEDVREILARLAGLGFELRRLAPRWQTVNRKTYRMEDHRNDLG